MSVRPEDVLADGVNTTERNGIPIRKGTMGAILANADILAAKDKTAHEKKEAIDTIRELAPALIALRLHKHLTWKNPDIQKIFDEISLNLKI